MVGLGILFMTSIGWITIGKDNWCPLWNPCQIFKSPIRLSFHQIILGSCNIWKMIMGRMTLLNFLYTWSKLIYCVFIVHPWIIITYLIIEFAYNWFGLLFANYTTMFATLKGRKWCSLIRFLFQEHANVVTYLTTSKP